MRHHPTLPPSSFPALLQCGHYKNANRPNGDAAAGTKLHALTEMYLSKQLGREMQSLPEDIKLINDVDPIDQENCQWAATEALTICAAQHPDMQPVDVQIEPELQLLADDGTEITFGHSDLVCRDVLIDFKSGFDFISEGKNYQPQLAVYALCIMREFGFEKIFCHEIYICPRRVVSYTIDYSTASAIVESVVARRAAATSNALLPQCNEYCKYCEHLLHCSAINRALVQIEGHDNGTMQPEAIKSPDVMGKALSFARMVLKPFIERVESSARAMSDAGTEIPGWKREAKAGRKKVSDIEAAYRACGLSMEGFLACCSVSLPELGKKYAIEQGVTQKAGRVAVEELLSGNIEKGTDTVSLVRAL